MFSVTYYHWLNNTVPIHYEAFFVLQKGLNNAISKTKLSHVFSLTCKTNKNKSTKNKKNNLENIIGHYHSLNWITVLGCFFRGNSS